MRLCALLGLLLTGVASGNSIIEVTPGSMGPWAFRVTGSTSTAKFVTGPGAPPLGNGSLFLTTAGDGRQSAQIRNTAYNGLSPNAFTALGYSTYETADSGTLFTYISIDVQFNNDNKVDDEINFSPQYQNHTTGNALLPDQGTVQTGVWQTWNAFTGGWWSQSGFGGATQGHGVQTIAAYLANTLGTFTTINNQPNTKITSITINNPGGLGGVKIQSGFGNQSDLYTGNADAFFVQLNNGTLFTYDFESNPEPATFLTLGIALAGMVMWRRHSPLTTRLAAKRKPLILRWLVPLETFPPGIGSRSCLPRRGVPTWGPSRRKADIVD